VRRGSGEGSVGAGREGRRRPGATRETQRVCVCVMSVRGFGGRLLSNSDWSRLARAHLVSLSLSSAPQPLTTLLAAAALLSFSFPTGTTTYYLDLDKRKKCVENIVKRE
jgi:hypothetical protein